LSQLETESTKKRKAVDTLELPHNPIVNGALKIRISPRTAVNKVSVAKKEKQKVMKEESRPVRRIRISGPVSTPSTDATNPISDAGPSTTRTRNRRKPTLSAAMVEDSASDEQVEVTATQADQVASGKSIDFGVKDETNWNAAR
jgi:hypothetical protein